MSMESQNVSVNVLLNPGVDRVFNALDNRERRQLLIELRDGRIEHESDMMARGRDEGRLQLRHNHLPKLMDMGFIDWNPETGDIAAGPRFDEIESLLTLIENHADELPPNWP